MSCDGDRSQDASEPMKESGPASRRDTLRGQTEIRAALEEMEAKVWYDRHRLLMQKRKPGNSQIASDVTGKAESTARTIEARYGKANLGPYSDFEWGMVNGKLSALRWVMGEEWDFLDT